MGDLYIGAVFRPNIPPNVLFLYEYIKLPEMAYFHDGNHKIREHSKLYNTFFGSLTIPTPMSVFCTTCCDPPIKIM